MEEGTLGGEGKKNVIMLEVGASKSAGAKCHRCSDNVMAKAASVRESQYKRHKKV